MGFYLRKSVKVGPLRFNLSSSGVGVSAGVRGFRVGTGPRGNYVHVGCSGVHYRHTFPRARPRSPRSVPSDVSPQPASPEIPPGTHEPLAEIESGSVTAMVDSSSSDLLAELNAKRRIARLGPVALGGGFVVVGFALLAAWPVWALALLLAIAALGAVFALRRDTLAKTSVLFYELDEEMERAYGRLHEWASALAGCSRVWHIEAEGAVRDRKYHAGASHLVRRQPTRIRLAEPPYLTTNIATVAIEVGRQTLHFFPDRLLVYDPGGVGAVAYRDLKLDPARTTFIEDGGVPPDAVVIDYTWRYVNRAGGPDRRFTNNPRLPVCQYDQLHLWSDSGLNERIQLSRVGLVEGFSSAVRHLGDRLTGAERKREREGSEG